MNRRVAELTRRWWSGELGRAGTALDVALAPAEAAYRLGTTLRNRAYDRGVLPSERVDIPVISVGNIAVGGTGKTPFTNWLAQRVSARGETPVIVHGGYAADEPELHRTWTPDITVVVDRDRVRAARRAQADGATVVVMDDAFQHRRLGRDLDIVLVSVERWSAAARLLPRGAWREPPAALERADLIVCVRKTPVAARATVLAAMLQDATGRPVMRVHLCAAAWRRDGIPAAPPTGDSLLVAGLADPGLFAANARAAGAKITTEMTFPDHWEYSDEDVARIRDVAADRPVITSAKDWIKLRGRMDAGAAWVLEQDLVVDDGESLLDEALGRALGR
jgi:tetraacyldisaccharide 4'-kinase